MKGRNHRRQILLFLLAILLPGIVFVFLTVRMISQEKELAQQRLSEEYRLVAREIGRHLLLKLENIKLYETASIPDLQYIPGEMNYAHPEIVIMCMVDGRQLMLPWEKNREIGEAKRLLHDPEFMETIRQAEREEFARRNFSRAAGLYEQTFRTAEHSVQKEYVRLLLARALFKSQRTEEALIHYRQIVRVPYTVTDDYGIPLSLYATERLFEYTAEQETVINHIRREVRQERWLSPAAFYFLLNLLEEFLHNNTNPEIQEMVAECYNLIQNQIQNIEQAIALKRDFPRSGLEVQEGEPIEKKEPLWVSYSNNEWIISLSASSPEQNGFLIVVSMQDIFSTLKSDSDFRETFPVEFTVVPEDDPDGMLLGSGFKGFGITFKEGQERMFSTPLFIQPVFYLPALSLFLVITLFGAYLLWRDVRREVQIAEMKSQFVSSVSHELKTPLTAIRMFAETLLLDRTKDTAAQAEYLDTIVNESQRLTRLLNNVLDFSKVEQGNRKYHREPASLYEIVGSAERAMEYPLRQQGFKLDVKTEEGIPDVRVDRDAIEQAILNLIHNAMKYSGDSRDISLHLQKKDSNVLIRVIDQGIGIDPKEHKRIFEKFYRTPSPENERIVGTGLGLALVSHIVEAHGGNIDLESEPGRGSIFSIYIPLEAES